MSETIESKRSFNLDDELLEKPKRADDLSKEARAFLDNYRINKIKSYKDIDKNFLESKSFYDEFIKIVEERIKAQYDERYSGINDEVQEKMGLKRKLQENLTKAGDEITLWRDEVLNAKSSNNINQIIEY